MWWAARLGLLRRYMTRQRRMHTMVSSIHGPDEQITVGGSTVVSIVPLVSAETGNVRVSFDVLSYAGTVTITAVADPDTVPDLPDLAAALHRRTQRPGRHADAAVSRGMLDGSFDPKRRSTVRHRLGTAPQAPDRSARRRSRKGYVDRTRRGRGGRRHVTGGRGPGDRTPSTVAERSREHPGGAAGAADPAIVAAGCVASAGPAAVVSAAGCETPLPLLPHCGG